MTVCRYFQQGYCKFGRKCRFEHIKPNSHQEHYNERGSFNSKRNQYDDSNSRSSKYRYIRPSQFSNRQQPQERFSSPLNRQHQDSNSQSRSFPSKKHDRYHCSSSTSNRFAPSSDSRNEISMTDLNENSRDCDVYMDANSRDCDVSKDESILTETDLAEFKVTSFTVGKIPNPIQPPPTAPVFQPPQVFQQPSDSTMTQPFETLFKPDLQSSKSIDANSRDCDVYMDELILTETDLAEFKATSFTVGKIPNPIQPPPTAPVFQPPQVFQQPSDSTMTQPFETLFKPDLQSSKSSDANSRDCDVYMDELILTETDLAEFKATSFTLGKIPMLPPPRSYCR